MRGRNSGAAGGAQSQRGPIISRRYPFRLCTGGGVGETNLHLLLQERPRALLRHFDAFRPPFSCPALAISGCLGV